MTAPSEEQVRAWLGEWIAAYDKADARNEGLSEHASEQRAMYRAALALLDAGRKDREALVIADEWFGGCDCITTETGTDERKRRYRELRRAAIDAARKREGA